MSAHVPLRTPATDALDVRARLELLRVALGVLAFPGEDPGDPTRPELLDAASIIRAHAVALAVLVDGLDVWSRERSESARRAGVLLARALGSGQRAAVLPVLDIPPAPGVVLPAGSKR